MKITGELLKSERTKKNLTVQDVAFALKLSPKIISSIEAGETDNLPAKTFIRGFVKSYAQFLKIDVDQVMRQFQEEMGSTNPLPRNATTQMNTSPGEVQIKTSPDSEPKKSSSVAPTEQAKALNESKGSRSLVYIGIAVVLVILIVATNRVVDRYQKEGAQNVQDISKVQPLNPDQGSSTPTPTTTPEVVSTDTSSAGLSAVSSDISSTKPNSSMPLQSLSSTTTSSTPPAAEIDDGFEPSSGKPIEIILEAKKDTEVLYARGNTKTFSKLKLAAKQVQVIRSTNGLHLKADDGGAFTMVVNGIDKGLAGTHNKQVRFSF